MPRRYSDRMKFGSRRRTRRNLFKSGCVLYRKSAVTIAHQGRSILKPEQQSAAICCFWLLLICMNACMYIYVHNYCTKAICVRSINCVSKFKQHIRSNFCKIEYLFCIWRLIYQNQFSKFFCLLFLPKISKSYRAKINHEMLTILHRIVA